MAEGFTEFFDGGEVKCDLSQERLGRAILDGKSALKEFYLVLALEFRSWASGLESSSFTVAQLPRVPNREEERGRQNPPQAHK